MSAHRTLALDAAFARVRQQQIEYPREVLGLPEFAEQMMAPVREGAPVVSYASVKCQVRRSHPSESRGTRPRRLAAKDPTHGETTRRSPRLAAAMLPRG